MISSEVLGVRPGQRVYVPRQGTQAGYFAIVVKTVVPKKGGRFALVIDNNGCHRHADLKDIDAGTRNHSAAL